MTELSQPFIMQHVLDALGRWAERATGVDVQHGEQNVVKPEPPYISLEWIDELAQAGPKIEYEVTAAPTSASFVVTAAALGWTALVVNNARATLQRGALEALTDFTDRLMALLVPMSTGRLTLSRAGDDGINVAVVTTGDLYRAWAIEGATVTTAGSGNAKVIERPYRGTVRVWCVGASPTSGQAGVAGTGRTTGELLAALMEGLDRPWCRELFDAFLMRRTGEPTVATARGRRLGPRREGRSYFDLPLGVTARFALATEPALVVPFALSDSPEPAPGSFAIIAPTGDTMET